MVGVGLSVIVRVGLSVMVGVGLSVMVGVGVVVVSMEPQRKDNIDDNYVKYIYHDD
jgi:hypothetical protein